jgi:hypothetical protein
VIAGLQRQEAVVALGDVNGRLLSEYGHGCLLSSVRAAIVAHWLPG